jgi:hypothetical protein
MLTPLGTNILYNPNGSKSLNGWSVYGSNIHWSSAYEYGGSIGAVLSAGTTIDEVLQQQIGQFGTSNSSLFPHSQYVGSGVITVQSINNGGQIFLDVLDSDGNIIGGSEAITQAGTYQLIFPITAENSSVAYFRLHIRAQACVAYFYDLQLEQGTIATVFSDDATPAIAALTQQPGGGIDLANGLNSNYNMDEIPTGIQYGKIVNNAISNAGRALIDFGDPSHLNKVFNNIGGSAQYSQLDPNSVGVALNSVGTVTGPGASVYSTGATQGIVWTTNDVETAIKNNKTYSPSGQYTGGVSGFNGYPGVGYLVGLYSISIPNVSNSASAKWFVEFDWRVFGCNVQPTLTIIGALQNTVVNTGHANAFYNVFGSYTPQDGVVNCYNENMSSSFSGSITLAANQSANIYCYIYAQCSNAIIVYAQGPYLVRCTQTQSRLEVGNYTFRATRYA